MASASAIASLPLAGCTAKETISDEANNLGSRDSGNQSDSESDTVPMEQTFDSDPRFDSIQWVNLGDILQVTFEEDHGMDAFALAHSYRTEQGQWMGTWDAPTFSGPVDINFAKELSQYSDSYPTRNFMLIGYNGSGDTVIHVEEKLTSVEFIMPRRISPAEYFDDVETTTLEN